MSIEEDLEFLKEFPKDNGDMFIVYECFTFDNLFQLLLKADFDHEDALVFMLTHCSMSAYVFQERIHNGRKEGAEPGKKIVVGEEPVPEGPPLLVQNLGLGDEIQFLGPDDFTKVWREEYELHKKLAKNFKK